MQDAFVKFSEAANPTAPCAVHVTAPDDMRLTASEVAQMGNAIFKAIHSNCRADGPQSFDANPDLEKEAMTGALDGTIIVHAAKDQKGSSEFFDEFGFGVKSKRSYDIPPSSPTNYMWLQFGKGVHWNI